MSVALSLLTLGACRAGGPAETNEKAGPAGPPTIEVVRVVEQPINVTLSLPGELTPFQTVALYSRVTGFVKAIGVDRGSRVHAGQELAVIEAPELVAQKSEAQSSCRAPRLNSAPVRSSRSRREHVRQAESGSGHTGRRRRQRCRPGPEGSRGRSRANRRRAAKRRGGAAGARVRHGH